MTILTLEEFRATRQHSPDIRVIMGDDEAGDTPAPGYLYAESCCIGIDPKDGSPYLTIFNQQWVKPLEELEEILYVEFYLPEYHGVAINVAREALQAAEENGDTVPESDRDVAADMIEHGVFGWSEGCVDENGDPLPQFTLAVTYARKARQV